VNTAAPRSLAQDIDGLNFGIEKSMRYHQRRRAHYDTLNKSLMLVGILAGSAAFANTWQNPQLFGLVGALVSALNLVWGFSHRARDHEILYRRFSELAIDLRATSAPSEANLHDWVRRRLAIEADEPAVFWAVEADCWNEVTRAWDRQKAGLAAIPRWCRLVQDWWRFETRDFPVVPPPSRAS
jgi:hypothetical protein